MESQKGYPQMKHGMSADVEEKQGPLKRNTVAVERGNPWKRIPFALEKGTPLKRIPFAVERGGKPLGVNPIHMEKGTPLKRNHSLWRGGTP